MQARVPQLLLLQILQRLLGNHRDTEAAMWASARVVRRLWTQCSESERGLKPATT